MATGLAFGWQVESANGTPVSGAKVYFYAPGTTTPRTTYTDQALTVPAANPVVADSAGWFLTYISSELAYDVVIKSGDDSITYQEREIASNISGAQPVDATLTAIAGLSVADGEFIQATGTDTFRTRALQVETQTALKAIGSTKRFDGMVVFMAGKLEENDGGQGDFVWITGNQSANVTDDPNQGVWIAPTDASTGASGAWRRIQDKDNEVDVLWFVETDSDAGRLAAGQAAVAYLTDVYANGVVIIPQNFVISTTWVIQSPDIILRGSGLNQSFILSEDTDAPCVVFQPSTAGVSAGYLDDGGIENLAVGYSAGAIGVAGSVALWVRMCQRFKAVGLRPVNGQIGLRISGGQLNTFERFVHFGTSGATGVKLESEAIGGGNYQTAYTMQFNGLIMSGSAASRAFDIASADGLSISNGYIAFHDDSHIRLMKERNDSIGQIFVNNIYFDGVDSQLVGGISPACILEAPSHAYGNSGVYIHFNNCTFANVTGDLWDVNTGLIGLRVSNSTFVNCTGWALDITLDGGDLTFVGNKFRNCGTAATYGAMSFAGTIGALHISDNDFEFNDYRQIQLAGTIGDFVCTGNTFRGTINDIVSTATITRQLVHNTSEASSPYGNRHPGVNVFSGEIRTNNSFTSVLAASTQGGVIANSTSLQASRDGVPVGYFRRTSSDGSLIAFYRDTTSVGSISVTTTATAFNTSSDYRLKDNIDYLDPAQAQAFIAALKPRRYDWKSTGEESWGFIAHEYGEHNPTAVTGDKDGTQVIELMDEDGKVIVDDDGNPVTQIEPEYQALSYSDPKLVASMVRELQSLRQEVEALQAPPPEPT